MTQAWNYKGYDYDMPAPVPYMLVHQQTTELWCRFGCGRSVHVDPIMLLDRYGSDFSTWKLDGRALCKACGARMKVTGGLQVSQLRRVGLVSTLVTSAEVRFRQPVFASPPHF